MGVFIDKEGMDAAGMNDPATDGDSVMMKYR